jgi:hypothetical protein
MITDKAMLVSIHFSVWTARKHDKRVTEHVSKEYNADSKAGRYNKRLLANAEKLEELNNLVGRIRKWVYGITLPWSDDGPRILPNELYFEFGKKWTEFENEFHIDVEAFLAAYMQYVEEVRPILGDMFREDEYPTIPKLREKFSISREILPVPMGADFRVSLNKAETERLAQELDEANKKKMAASIRELWQRLYDVVYHMATSLSQAEKRIYSSTVDNVRDLVYLLPLLNIAGDTELTVLTERTRTELCKYTAEYLRRDPEARKEIAEAAAEIVKAIADKTDIPAGVPSPINRADAGDDDSDDYPEDNSASAPLPAPVPIDSAKKTQDAVDAITARMLPFMHLAATA